jgi:hypothetical protein
MATKPAWTLTQIAELLGISERHAFRLVDEHILVGAGSRYDPLDCAKQYIKHISKDAEGRKARTELARVEAKRKTLLMKRQLGQMLTPVEQQAIDEEFFGLVMAAFNKAMSEVYGALAIHPALNHKERMLIAGTADQNGKAWLIEARNSWRQRLQKHRGDLRDPERVARLFSDLEAEAGGHE